jgi:hypothetical protein
MFRFYTKTESFDVSIEPKETEDQPKQFDREHFFIFSENLGLFRFVLNSSVCFDIGSKHRNKQKFLFLVSRNKPKQNRNRSGFGLFRFKPKIYFVCFEDTYTEAVI